jgi:hypothetical protein
MYKMDLHSRGRKNWDTQFKFFHYLKLCHYHHHPQHQKKRGFLSWPKQLQTFMSALRELVRYMYSESSLCLI